MDIPCPHFGPCSGCLFNTQVDSPPIYKDARRFFDQQGIRLGLNAGNPIHWRCRAKLAVRKDAQLGLFKAGTHDVLPIPECQVHHPSINKAAKLTSDFCREAAIPAYEETTGKGLLRYVQFTVERQTRRVQAVLVLNMASGGARLLESLWNKAPSFWHSIWVNYNQRKDNVIFDNNWQLVSGEQWLWENFCGVDICLGPSSFYQSNPEMFEKLLLKLHQFVPHKAKIVEYYAGVGLIGLTLVNADRTIQCAEINDQSKACFEMSRQKLPASCRDNIAFTVGNAKDLCDLAGEADVIIVDPPRKGLDSQLLNRLLAEKGGKTLIYVSCGWESCKRDSFSLIQSGWKLIHAEAFLLFPGSNHIETLVIFQR